MNLVQSDILSRKKIDLMNCYLDMILKSTESQYGYIYKVERMESFFNYSRIAQMYYARDLKASLLIDDSFNFLEDIHSTLEFYHQQVLSTGKPLILNNSRLKHQAFTVNHSYLGSSSAWFIIPVYHYEEIVAIIGLIGSPLKFNVYFYEMLQPFMILCSELISSIFN